MKRGTIIAKLTINNYPKEINITNSRKKKYYTIKSNIPSKYLNKNYGMKDGFLVDKNSGEKIIKNKASVNKPRVYTLSGQDIWATMNHHLRSKVSKELKKYFYGQISVLEQLPEDSYPIGVELIFYDVIAGEDLDNLSIWYRKVIHDALCGNVEYKKDDDGKYNPIREGYKQIIPDDSKEYIQSIPTNFIPIENTNKRKLIIKLFKI